MSKDIQGGVRLSLMVGVVSCSMEFGKGALEVSSVLKNIPLWLLVNTMCIGRWCRWYLRGVLCSFLVRKLNSCNYNNGFTPVYSSDHIVSHPTLVQAPSKGPVTHDQTLPYIYITSESAYDVCHIVNFNPKTYLY